jgi:stringent starvation protein B
MTSSRPYLIRAIYEWLVDNGKTPYVMVDAMVPEVRVPEQYIEDGKIVLNMDPRAIAGLRMGNEVVEFNARFSGVSYHLVLPIQAVKAIYAFENGRGMVFSDEEEDAGGSDMSGSDFEDYEDDSRPQDEPPKGKKPSLKIVK